MGKVPRTTMVRTQRAKPRRTTPRSRGPTRTMTTHVVVVLDRTGSMDACRDQTISGFNEWLAALKAEARQRPRQDYRVTVVKFDKHTSNLDIEVQYRGVPLETVEPLTLATYVPRGLTPLYDAIMQTLAETESVHADRVLFVIVTDGLENASVRHTRAECFRQIQAKQQLGTWTVVFIGANQDAYVESQTLGIPRGNALNWDPAQTSTMWTQTTSATQAYLQGQALGTTDFWTMNSSPQDSSKNSSKARSKEIPS